MGNSRIERLLIQPRNDVAAYVLYRCRLLCVLMSVFESLVTAFNVGEVTSDSLVACTSDRHESDAQVMSTVRSSWGYLERRWRVDRPTVLYECTDSMAMMCRPIENPCACGVIAA